MPYEPTDQDINNLYRAIGRVASESANTEKILRETLRSYASMDEALGVVFEGQSLDWLTNSIVAIFKVSLEALAEGNAEYQAAIRDLEAIRDEFAKLRPLRDRRNFIIHGTWYICEAIKGEDECLVALPVPGTIELPVFHFRRSRNRRFYESEEHVSIPDVDNLADCFKRQNGSLTEFLNRIRPKMWF